MAAIVSDPSSSSLCTADLLLIKPPAPLFPPFPSFFIYSFQKVVADTAIRLRPYRFADTISPPWRGDRPCGAFSIGKNRGRIVSRISIASHSSIQRRNFPRRSLFTSWLFGLVIGPDNREVTLRYDRLRLIHEA